MSIIKEPFFSKYSGKLAAGVDEVGRGSLAGDVVASAVILDPRKSIIGLNDSKKISEKKRNHLFDIIKTNSLSWSISRCSVKEIDKINILQASLLAMTKAVKRLVIQPEHVWVDGNKLPAWDYSAKAVVKGDSQVSAIAAASILAKVTRDREMIAYDKKYPGYRFASHKGYPTKMHLELLIKLGVTPIHRVSYAPVKRVLEKLSYTDTDKAHVV